MLLPVVLAAQTETGQIRPTATPEEKQTAPAPTNAADPILIIETGASYEHLSNGYGNWQTYFLSFNRKFSTGQTLYGTASSVTRFGLTDPNFMVGYVQPLDKSKHWTTTFEASGSPSHNTLPTLALFGQLTRVLGKGWVGSAGIRYSHYTTDKVNMGVFGIEKYVKAYRAAYTMYVAHLNGRGTSVSHLFQGNYYYGERNSVGVAVAFGQEIENINGRLIRTDVRDVSLVGRHWMTKRWGVSYVGVWHRQGTFYTRSGAQIGVLLSF